MAKVTKEVFAAIKESLKAKNGVVRDVARKSKFSVRTIQRVKASRSFKGYKELCNQ